MVTLSGPAVPRRGRAMSEVAVIPDGAVLIVDGVIEQVGPSRRVERLAVSNDAEARCFEVFPEFMGVTWEQSDYDIQTWWPSEQSWVTKRDRTVLCAVYKVTGGRTKGSVRGSAQ